MKKTLQICWKIFSGVAVALLVLRAIAPGLPIFDSGHACVAVKNDGQAKDSLIEGLALAAGLTPLQEIEAGPTHQTLLSDGITVPITVSTEGEWADWAKVPANARSIVVKNPIKAGNALRRVLMKKYPTEVRQISIPGKDDPIVVVSSQALDNVVVVFRRHAILMVPWPRTLYVFLRTVANLF